MKPKVMILHNMITPYRLPLFEELSKKYDLSVYFCKTKDKDRKWSTKLKGYSFSHKILKHFNFGPFAINPELKGLLKKNIYDYYIVFENPENANSILKVIKYAKKNKKKIIILNGRKDDEIYSMNQLRGSKNPLKSAGYLIIKSIYHKYRNYVYGFANSFISYCRSSTKYLISNSVPKDNIFTGTQNMPKILLPNATWKSRPNEYGNKKIIFHIGYLNRDKGVHYIINAFNQMGRKDTLLLIAGSGEYEENLRKLSKQNKNIVFLGHLNKVERANYYSICDFSIFASFHDAWSHVVAESLYYNKPVIVSCQDEARELIKEGETGFIINDKSTNELKGAMEKMLDNQKLLTQMKKNVKKIPKSKIVDINTTVKIFENAINYASKQNGNNKK
jgi:glycosyltransferase involved in cell wall biosynthesis